MGSRLRQDVKHFFECFCEVVGPKDDDTPAWIIQKFPESYKDESVLKSVPKFAFPCEFDKTVPQHYSFVLTSLDSKWTFGFCRHDPRSETALVVLSSLPWHEAFSKFLNYVSELMQGSHSDHLWKFLDTIYQSKIPQVEGADLSVSIHPSIKKFTCEAPSPFKLPSIPENRNLTEYYNAVDNHNMMVIFASMLYERRIIFTSKKLSRLSACVQSANALLYPMSWQHIFIPVLPQSLIDYLLAPMPYLIGLPHSLVRQIKQNDLGEVVMLDADSNTVETPFHDLESLPSDVVHNLQKQLRNRSAVLGDGVSRAFLRALVQLIGGYRDALKISQGKKITFCKEAFIESRPSSIQPFLKKMLELQIFQQFIEERLDLLNAGLGFSDEFELEVCNYSDRSGSKIAQYKEWVHTMRKEGSAFFLNVRNRANPAVRSAFKTVKEKGKNARLVYKGFKSKLKDKKDKPNSVPSSPTSERAHFPALDLKISSSGSSGDRSQFHLLEDAPLSSSQSNEELSPLNMDLMGDLQDVIFRNYHTVADENDNKSTVHRLKLPSKSTGENNESKNHPDSSFSSTNTHENGDFASLYNTFSSSKSESSFSQSEPRDLIRLDSSSSIGDFDPLTNGEHLQTSSTDSSGISPVVGVSNPLYSFYYINNKKPGQKDSDLLNEYGINFTNLRLPNETEHATPTTVAKSKSEWTKFE